MGKFVAKLSGEADDHVVSRQFEHKQDAIAWLRGAGLAEFDDQTALGEIFDAEGHRIWAEPNLQTIEQQERARMRDYARRHAQITARSDTLVEFGFPPERLPKPPKPMKR